MNYFSSLEVSQAGTQGRLSCSRDTDWVVKSYAPLVKSFSVGMGVLTKSFQPRVFVVLTIVFIHNSVGLSVVVFNDNYVLCFKEQGNLVKFCKDKNPCRSIAML